MRLKTINFNENIFLNYFEKYLFDTDKYIMSESNDKYTKLINVNSYIQANSVQLFDTLNQMKIQRSNKILNNPIDLYKLININFDCDEKEIEIKFVKFLLIKNIKKKYSKLKIQNIFIGFKMLLSKNIRVIYDKYYIKNFFGIKLINISK